MMVAATSGAKGALHDTASYHCTFAATRGRTPSAKRAKAVSDVDMDSAAASSGVAPDDGAHAKRRRGRAQRHCGIGKSAEGVAPERQKASACRALCLPRGSTAFENAVCVGRSKFLLKPRREGSSIKRFSIKRSSLASYQSERSPQRRTHARRTRESRGVLQSQRIGAATHASARAHRSVATAGRSSIAVAALDSVWLGKAPLPKSRGPSISPRRASRSVGGATTAPQRSQASAPNGKRANGRAVLPQCIGMQHIQYRASPRSLRALKAIFARRRADARFEMV